MERLMGGNGWRFSALVVLAGLVLIVVLARLGAPPAPPPVAPSFQVAVEQTTGPTTSRTLSPTPTRSPPPAVLVLGVGEIELWRSPWADRFADGIPRAIDGVEVRRFDTVSSLAPFSAVGPILIGGWYEGPSEVVNGCSRVTNHVPCPPGRLADNPAALADGQGTRVTGGAPAGSGARVIRGTLHVACGERPLATADCRPRIIVDGEVWRGDELTRTNPIKVVPLLSGLASDLPEFRPVPYHDAPECTLPRPAQAWFSSVGPVRFVYLFATSQARFAGATALLNGPPYGDAASGCAALEPLDGTDGWIGAENVLIRVADVDGEDGASVRQLLDELIYGPGSGVLGQGR